MFISIRSYTPDLTQHIHHSFNSIRSHTPDLTQHIHHSFISIRSYTPDLTQHIHHSFNSIRSHTPDLTQDIHHSFISIRSYTQNLTQDIHHFPPNSIFSPPAAFEDKDKPFLMSIIHSNFKFTNKGIFKDVRSSEIKTGIFDTRRRCAVPFTTLFGQGWKILSYSHRMRLQRRLYGIYIFFSLKCLIPAIVNLFLYLSNH